MLHWRNERTVQGRVCAGDKGCSQQSLNRSVGILDSKLGECMHTNATVRICVEFLVGNGHRRYTGAISVADVIHDPVRAGTARGGGGGFSPCSTQLTINVRQYPEPCVVREKIEQSLFGAAQNRPGGGR